MRQFSCPARVHGACSRNQLIAPKTFLLFLLCFGGFITFRWSLIKGHQYFELDTNHIYELVNAGTSIQISTLYLWACGSSLRKAAASKSEFLSCLCCSLPTSHFMRDVHCQFGRDNSIVLVLMLQMSPLMSPGSRLMLQMSCLMSLVLLSNLSSLPDYCGKPPARD